MSNNSTLKRNDQPYDVGYGKPPKEGQFVKGQSGNPYGRPRYKPTASSLVTKALNEQIVIVENGTQKIITKFEAIFKQLVNKAASGDSKALQVLLRFVSQIEADMVRDEALGFLSAEQDKKLIEDAFGRFMASQPDNSTDQSDKEPQ